MKKILDLDDWLFDPTFPDDSRIAEVNIHLKYTELNSLVGDSPTERKKKIAADLNNKFKKLIHTNLFENYELIGTSRKPRGIRTRIVFTTLEIIEKLDFIETVFINKVVGARKKRRKKLPKYFCVKMTVAIEVEGFEKGMQQIEERFVLIKAESHDNAFELLERNKENYSEPYLNSDGRLVRWKIESFDDSYETDIHEIADLNNPEGAEVFSKFKSRRLTKERIWKKA